MVQNGSVTQVILPQRETPSLTGNVTVLATALKSTHKLRAAKNKFRQSVYLSLAFMSHRAIWKSAPRLLEVTGAHLEQMGLYNLNRCFQFLHMRVEHVSSPKTECLTLSLLTLNKKNHFCHCWGLNWDKRDDKMMIQNSWARERPAVPCCFSRRMTIKSVVPLYEL